MKTCLVLISHNLIDEQEKDLKKNGIDKIIRLPENLLNKWANVPPEIDSLKNFSKQFVDWIKSNSKEEDFVWVQGDFGLTNIIVDYSLKSGLIPVYSTTERIHEEVKLPDGSVSMKKTFKHKIFRRYERWKG